MNKPSDLSEAAAKADLEALQKKYGALVVSFNNQQAELAALQRHNATLEQEKLALQERTKENFSESDQVKQLEDQVHTITGVLSAHRAACVHAT